MPTWWRGSAATPTRMRWPDGSATTSRSAPTATGSTGPGRRLWACCEHVGRAPPRPAGDGGGLPVGARGDAIPGEMRVVQLADVAEVHLRLAGVDGAVGMARSRSGTQFDPAIAATFGR